MMRFLSQFPTWLGLFVIAILLSRAAVPAHAVVLSAVSHVSQGDAILWKNKYQIGFCTVGFVDTERNSLYTAGHCGGSGAQIYLGQKADADSFIGHLETGYDATTDYSFNDISLDYGMVDIQNPTTVAEISVSLGKNSITGDLIAEHSEVPVGAHICSYGAATAYEICNEIVASRENVVVARGRSYNRAGNSGGPAWIKLESGQRAFVGVVSGGNRSQSLETFVMPFSESKGSVWVEDIASMLPPDETDRQVTLPIPIPKGEAPDRPVSTGKGSSLSSVNQGGEFLASLGSSRRIESS